MTEQKFIMSDELKRIEKEAKKLTKKTKLLNYKYKKRQKTIREEVLKNFDDNTLLERKKLIDRIGDLKIELKETQRLLREKDLIFKRERRLITKSAYKDNSELQTLKKQVAELNIEVDKKFKAFNKLYQKEYDNWRKNKK